MVYKKLQLEYVSEDVYVWGDVCEEINQLIEGFILVNKLVGKDVQFSFNKKDKSIVVSVLENGNCNWKLILNFCRNKTLFWVSLETNLNQIQKLVNLFLKDKQVDIGNSNRTFYARSYIKDGIVCIFKKLQNI